MINLTGKNFIGNELSGAGKEKFQAVNPVTSDKLQPEYFEATDEEIDRAIEKAEEAFRIYRKVSGKARAQFLETIGDEIMNLGDELVERSCAETGLPAARITGERGRTVNQLKLFASLLKEGSWVNARIDTADPERKPAPKPDIRSLQIALGPVGIFGASNFPLAFSVAGGDTASALAAGCSVVVKAHPAHPGTCEMIATAISTAVKKSGMPDGVFSMVGGTSQRVGLRIVTHPFIKAIGFTGSFRGGKALFDAAAGRSEPIPVFAEMGSVNPVFILPRAMKEKKDEIAEGLAASVTLGVGQFCTNPGIFVSENSGAGNEFRSAVGESLKKINPGHMLTAGISHAYREGINKLGSQPGVQIMARGGSSTETAGGIPHLFQVSSKDFNKNELLEKEVFGPSTLAVTSENKEDIIRIAEKIGGNLTATLYATEEDLKEYDELVSVLERKAGRLIINGFPTGVEVCHSMIHGGPFPATTDSRSTSVGTTAIYRFTRPVSYQNFPDHLLPDELKKENPLKIMRLVNGNFER